MGEGPSERVFVSLINVGDPRNPWSVIDVPARLAEVQAELNRTAFVISILDKARVQRLMLFWVLSQAYPQYFLIRRGAIGKGRDCIYNVNVREESFEGQAPCVMGRMLLRASATVLYDVGLRSGFEPEALAQWFGTLPGRDRFDMEPRAWKV